MDKIPDYSNRANQEIAKRERQEAPQTQNPWLTALHRCVMGIGIGATIGVVVSIAIFALLALGEFQRYGRIDWDKSVGMGFIPIILIPFCAFSGFIGGGCWAIASSE